VNFPLHAGAVLQLERSQAHYLYNVLRLREGQKIVVIGTDGIPFVAELGPRSQRTCTVLTEAGELDREPHLKVRLYVPLLKGDKLELAAQKAVELGVGEIVLYSAERSIAKWQKHADQKIARLQKIMLEAARQCRRQKAPELRGVLSFPEVLEEKAPGIFAWEQERSSSLNQCLQHFQSAAELALLTGPEGGLSPREVNTLIDAGWRPVTLGARILRAETAAITLLACTMFAMGEMG